MPPLKQRVWKRLQRTLVGWYLIAVLFVVLFVPWTDPKFHITHYGYGSLFSPPNAHAVIDYGTVILELMLVTFITGLIWFIRR